MESKNRIFLDATILLTILLGREGQKTAKKFLLAHANDTLQISSLNGHLVMHFKPKELSMQTAKLFLQDFEMLGLLHDDFSLAFQIAQDEDFEDALQIATALRSGSTEFITFDKKLAKNYANLPTLKMTLLE